MEKARDDFWDDIDVEDDENNQVETTPMFKRSINDIILANIFPDVDFSDQTMDGEVRVKSPLPRMIGKNGLFIYEENPSFSVNVEKGLWTDFSDNIYGKSGGTLFVLFKLVYQLNDNITARSILNELRKADTERIPYLEYYEQLKSKQKLINILKEKYFISEKVIDDFKLGFTKQNGELFSVPVIEYNIIRDLRTYYPNKKPKVKSLPGSKAGLMIGYEQWKRDLESGNKTLSNTIICAGEKDMLVARSLGLNAITFTGGEATLPKNYLTLFKGKKVYIMYDNDDTGKAGGQKFAYHLAKNGAIVKNVIGHHLDTNINHIKGTDLFDVVNFYGKDSIKVLKNYFKEAVLFDKNIVKKIKDKEIKVVSLNKAGRYNETTISSKIQTLTGVQKTWIIPQEINLTYIDKIDAKGWEHYSKQEQEDLKKYASWNLDEHNLKDIFYLMQDETKTFNAIIKNLLYLSTKNIHVLKMETHSKIDVNKHSVISWEEGTTINSDNKVDESSNQQIVRTVYLVGDELDAGKKYNLTYRMVGNPIDKSIGVIVASDNEEINSLGKFELNDEMIKSLKIIQQDNNLDIQTRLENLYQQDLTRVEKYSNWNMWLITNLVFTTPLKFLFGRQKVLKAATLDIILLGATRAGKSVMANSLLAKYKIGKHIDAGGATVRALTGGTDDKGGGSYVTHGALARENGGLVKIEEIKDLAKDIFPAIRSARSDNNLKISRVAGELDIPLFLRKLYISNPKTEGTNLNINDFKNGLEAVKSIIPSPEDLARFDVLFLVDSIDDIRDIHGRDTPNPYTYKYAEKWDDIHFQNAIKRIWTLKPDEIDTSEINEYCYHKAKVLTNTLDGLENIYSTEAEFKLMKLSIALASLLVSFNDDFTKLIVKKEHVDYMLDFLIQIYLNRPFRWKEQMIDDKAKSVFTDRELKEMQDKYISNAGNTLIEFLHSLGDGKISKWDIVQNAKTKQDGQFENDWKYLWENKFVEIVNGLWKTTRKFKDIYLLLDKTKVVNESQQEADYIDEIIELYGDDEDEL